MNNHKGMHPPGRPSVANAQTGGASPGASTKAGDQAVARASGRAAFDSRGNSIWEWQTEEGKFSSDVNTNYVKKLEAPELTLEDTAKISKVERPELQSKKAAGFNPYDRGALGDSAPAKSVAAEPERKPIKDLRRYNEWLKMKQRMADQKDDD